MLKNVYGLEEDLNLNEALRSFLTGFLNLFDNDIYSESI